MNTTRRSLGALAALAALSPIAAMAQDVGTAQRPLRIGVTAGPHAQTMEKVREIAARDGLAIRIVEFTDYIQPNAALAAGDLDANSYQHQPFLDAAVRDRRLPLVSVAKTMIFPMGLYSRRHKKAEEVPNGARIAVPNDPSNGGRALVLLAKAGLFTLKAGADSSATVADITANPRRIRVVELEAAQLPRALEEVDLAAINTNYAINAGLNPVRDSIAIEDKDSPYANVIAVQQKDRDAPWVRRLLAAYQNDEVKNFVETTFQGSVVPAF
ncbi:MetQ/NlpA family ABC transporter substrate-binding protein [Roseomonas sp. KE2513]|uniref:MetQ/NlpA family ABC transporter substrate-binding protein n=1 Tax=Roseomonas sp. KE2513 TaxID=2479202 RepID=UPI0018E02227|nr:MetQ/NlpA family ABC transporter substrate-binding protein [Roseomonas sp. KE2513]MBI0537142.1 MetQ/NlpA family ABC transporter substrate-binding protein [Roseomonas sp. KE2513]